MRSFRATLALRVGLVALGLALVVVLGATLFLRARLLSNLDASLVAVAELESNYGAESDSPDFQFRSDRFSSGPEPERRYWAQLLSNEGRTLVLSANLPAPLPVPGTALDDARRGDIGFATHRAGANREAFGSPVLRTVIYPLARRDAVHREHLLQVSTPLAPYREALADFAFLASGLGFLGATLAWLVALVVANRALTPALGLTQEVEAIGINELDRRVAVPVGLREFNRMAVAFNSLLERVERAVTGTRRFTADASHELRAPLTVLRGELELALTRPRAGPEYEDVIRRCLDEVLRLTRLADDLLTLARVEGGVIGAGREPIDLDDLVTRALEKGKPLADSRRVAMDVAGSAGELTGDGDLLLRAVDSLLEHAVMASPEGSRVLITLDSAPGGRKTVTVTDSGAGLRPDEISGVFQRFYRWNRMRIRSAESGLGLTIARAVAIRHGGSLEYVGNDPGASFQMSLPDRFRPVEE